MSEKLLGFVGDVHINRENSAEVFSKVGDILKVPDIMYGNLEGAYSDDPTIQGWCCTPTKNLNAYATAGFDVMSLANNHVADAGYGAMLEARSRLRSRGIMTCGAGASIADAREPAIVEVDGLKVAYLAYASVFPIGWEARDNAPGIAPMRAYNVWQEVWPDQPPYHSPGMVPIITTTPDPSDLAYLRDDIRRAKENADVVITCFHWGDQTRRYHLTDHETRTAKYCIDSGADMVVGHHQHALRGMEWYKGKPIMYGLGHFVFDVRWEWSEAEARKHTESKVGRYFKQVEYKGGPQEGWPLLPFPDESRMTVLAWAVANRDGINAIGVLPCRLTSDGVVNPLSLTSPEGMEVARYLEQCNETQDLNGRTIASGDWSIGGFQTLNIVPK